MEQPKALTKLDETPTLASGNKVFYQHILSYL